MKKLLKYFEGYKKYLFLGPFFKLLEAVFELIVPLVTAKIIDVGIYSGDRDYIIKMSLVIIFLGLAGLAFALTCQYFAAKCAYGFGTKLRTAERAGRKARAHGSFLRRKNGRPAL